MSITTRIPGLLPRLLPSLPSLQNPRLLSSSTLLLARRKQEFDPNASRSESEFRPIDGDWQKDGLNRYELDFLETAEWTKDVLLRLKGLAGALLFSINLFIYGYFLHERLRVNGYMLISEKSSQQGQRQVQPAGE